MKDNRAIISDIFNRLCPPPGAGTRTLPRRLAAETEPESIPSLVAQNLIPAGAGWRPDDVRSSYFPYGREMTIAGQFIPALQAEQRLWNVFYEIEQHLKHEFRKLGRDAGLVLAAAVEAEINRLERQVATLRRLRDGILGAA